MEIVIRPIEAADVEAIPPAFAAVGWPKPREQFERYVADQAAGVHEVRVAYAGGEVCGYLKVVWRPEYAPWRQAGIPEIQDLNVLPAFRRRGVATRLMDAAEALIAERSPVAGIGVALYADSGPAQVMYVRRGYVPDGLGATYHNQRLAGGETVVADDDLVLHLTRRLR
ncbi:MAG TPA: GNAT family N-acetyltransferase [Longimicrobium sp.]